MKQVSSSGTTYTTDTPRRKRGGRNPYRKRDWEAFCEEVVKSYDKAPSIQRDEVWRWKKLARHIEKMYRRMLSRVKVEFVEGQPYDNVKQMRREVEDSGTLYISTDFNEHTIFTPEQNLKFRTVHDYVVHILGGDQGPDFSRRGEIRAYNLHKRMVPPDTWPALFTEVAAQACYVNNRGVFPEQKVAILPEWEEFDRWS